MKVKDAVELFKYHVHGSILTYRYLSQDQRNALLERLEEEFQAMYPEKIA